MMKGQVDLSGIGTQSIETGEILQRFSPGLLPFSPTRDLEEVTDKDNDSDVTNVMISTQLY